MYANLIGFSYAFQQPTEQNHLRTLAAVVSFAVGAIVGWPFSLLLAVPFVFEEFFVYGADRVSSARYGEWLSGRIRRFITSCVVASLVFVSLSHPSNRLGADEESRCQSSWLIHGHTGNGWSSPGISSSITFSRIVHEDPIYMAQNHGISISSTCR